MILLTNSKKFTTSEKNGLVDGLIYEEDMKAIKKIVDIEEDDF